MRNILRINLNIGAGCFVSCPGCYNHFGKSFIEIQSILNFLEYIAQFGIRHITLGGGDPLTYPNIIILLKEIKNIGYRINLDTVGTPFLQNSRSIFFKRVDVPRIDSLELAKYVDLLGIPLDGPNSEVISTFRTKRKNIYEELLEIIQLLDKNKANLCINTVVHRMNIEHLDVLPTHLEHIQSVSKWQFFQFMPIGPLGYKNKDQYKISEKEFYNIKDRIYSNYRNSRWKNTFEFKSNASRKGNYLFIDSDGIAWLPDLIYFDHWNPRFDETNKKRIIGSIKNKEDFSKIKDVITQPAQNLEKEFVHQ